MTADYWLGVLSVPAALLGLAAAWLVVKLLATIGDKLLTGGVVRLTPETPRGRRAAMCAVLYGTRRVWMFAPGGMAFVFAVGLDADEARRAASLLEPRVGFNDLTA